MLTCSTMLRLLQSDQTKLLNWSKQQIIERHKKISLCLLMLSLHCKKNGLSALLQRPLNIGYPQISFWQLLKKKVAGRDNGGPPRMGRTMLDTCSLILLT